MEQLVTRAQVSPATTTHFVHDRSLRSSASKDRQRHRRNGGRRGHGHYRHFVCWSRFARTREYIYLYEAEIAPTMDSRTVVDRPLAVVNAVNTATPATYWVSVDHLNRPVKMTTATKASVWDAIWQPWGGAHSLIVTGTAVFDARFPGQWFQTETGLHYNWHRSYDPTLGRYTQPDPLGFVDGPSVYGYAGGSPLRYVDRDGRDAFADPLTEVWIFIILPTTAAIQYCRQQWGKWVKVTTPTETFKRTIPETCSQNEHDDRQDEINRSCKPKPARCKLGQPNPQTAAQAYHCATLRRTQINSCFGNTGGDTKHNNEANDWWELYASCR
jgi:RHS repeat-associated protein